MKTSILFGFLLLLVLAFFCGETAHAQLFIEEAKVNLSVSGGDRVNKSITVDNTSKEEVAVRVYWEDFQYQPPYDGTKQFFQAGTVSGSASAWIQYLPQEFRIPPFGKQKVDYTLAVPANIEGGHYGVLFFERSTAPATDVTGVKVVTRIGCLFFIEAKNKVKKAGMGDIVLTGNDLAGTLTNSGNVVLIPAVTYYIMDASGLVADRGELARAYVPPRAVSSWKVSLPPGLSPGRYSLVVNADLDEGDMVVKEITLQKTTSGEFLVEKVQD